MHANKREEIKEVLAGDIAAAVGLRDVTTGDTICDENKPILLESMDFPEPVISVAIEPKTKADQEKMGVALGQAGAGRSDVQDPHRSRYGADDHFRNGRTASGNHRRPHDARVQRRRQRRQAAGGLQGNDPQEGRSRRQIHPPDRRPRPVRSRARSRSSPAESGAGFVFENEIIGGIDPEGIHQADRAGNSRKPWRAASSPATK